MSQSLSLSPAPGSTKTSSAASDGLTPRGSWFVRLWRAANADFCPDQNVWAYKLKEPLALLTIATALALFCGYVINPLAYVLGGMLAFVLAAGLAWPAIAIRGIAAEVDWGRSRATEGQTVGVTLRLRNRLPIPLAGLVAAGLEGVGDAKLPALRPRESRTIVWRATTRRRGIFPMPSVSPATDDSDETEGVQVRTAMPFGVWTARRPLDVSGRLIVHPLTTPLDGLVDLGEPRSGEERPTDRRAGTTGDLLGVRRFREGDSLRHVHWAQTARQRELIVCERQATIASAVRIGVDLPADAERLETVLRAAASVARRLIEGGMAVELALPDATLRCDGQMVALLDGLAAVRLPSRDRQAPADVSLRLGYDPRCRLRLDRVPLDRVRLDPGDDWSAAVSAAWRRLCRAA